MKRIINTLYRDPESDLGSFREEHVQSALTTLSGRLETELGKTYRWMAACTVAVTAGCWGGDRRLRRRIKLLAMINQCRVRLGQDPVAMGDNRWASVNLYYGYGAIGAYAADRGVTRNHSLILGVLDSKGVEAAIQAANILRPLTSGDHA